MRYLAADIGSTYTKLTAVDSDSARVVGTASAFTTIADDVMIGFAQALERLQESTGGFAPDTLLCCSSAAGGLSMIAVGLVPELTAKAARMAAESAGAKVIRTYAYELSPTECDEIRNLRPDIILLSGGTDGGNKDAIIANARKLTTMDGSFAIIAAGNKSAEGELRDILSASDKDWRIAANVMPVFGTLCPEPARQCVRDVFIQRIIEAKGLSRIQAMSAREIIPTPLAVLRACELLSRGTAATPGIGDFMAIDLGGATTDVYSLCSGEPTLDNVMLKGLPEPYAKRTVEGDLGMRYSARFLLEDAGAGAVAEAAGVSADEVREWVERCFAMPETLAPGNSRERRMDEALARFAVSRAVERHAGLLERVYTPLGESFVLTGKDLSRVPLVLGIGGILAHSANAVNILRGAAMSPRSMAAHRAVPREPHYALDSGYIFSALGLLSGENPELALEILKRGTRALPEVADGTAQ
jgi:uncharacterized protein (TIGR01319 family)